MGEIRVLTVGHRKGGVGKTTTVVHLATGLAGLKVPVVAMDLDPQGNLGEFLGLGRAPDMFEMLMSRQPERLLDDVLTPVPNYSQLRLVLSNDETKAAERALGAPESSRSLSESLRNVVQAIGNHDFFAGSKDPLVIIDTPPGLGSLQMAALAVADYLIIPINPSFASETGIPKVAEQIQAIREVQGRGARLLGLLPTRYKRRTIEHRTMMHHLKESFGELLVYPPVRDTVRLEEAPAMGLPVWDVNDKCGGARDYIQVVLRLVDDLNLEIDVEGE